VNPVFSRPGVRVLAGSWALLVVSVIGGIALVLGSHWFLDRERRENANYERRIVEARGRLDAARRERDSLQQSAEVFRTLVDRGLLQAERRLDLVELVNALRARHQLFTLDYEISPQRPLVLPGGRVYPSVDVLASRVKLRVRALHEGDVLAFIESLTDSRQGFYPVDRCALKRLETVDVDSVQPRVEADCTLEWITLKEKRAARPS
jgi:hypothetical protein